MLVGSAWLCKLILIIDMKVRDKYKDTWNNICLIYIMHLPKNQGTWSITSLENEYRHVIRKKSNFENAVIIEDFALQRHICGCHTKVKIKSSLVFFLPNCIID